MKFDLIRLNVASQVLTGCQSAGYRCIGFDSETALRGCAVYTLVANIMRFVFG